MKARKTIPVKQLVQLFNDKLASDNFSADEKAMICYFIETVLQESGNYNGFQFLVKDSQVGDLTYYDRLYNIK